MDNNQPSRGARHFQGVADWEPLVVQAAYSGPTLARQCRISLRHLQRHIRAKHGMALGSWLHRFRMKHAYAKLAEGGSVKVVAIELAYKQVSHFSRHFKAQYGFSPSCVKVGSTGAEALLAPPGGLP